MNTKEAKKYQVVFNGKVMTYINPNLVKKQGITDTVLKKIKKLHRDRIAIEEEMELCDSSDVINLKSLFDKWTDVQFSLQEAWGFKKDKSFHKFWTVPHCSCSYDDNEDDYMVSGIFHTDNKCPVHGVG